MLPLSLAAKLSRQKKEDNVLFSLAGEEEKREENGMRNSKHMVCCRILMRLICFRNTLSSNLIVQRQPGLQTLSGLVGRPYGCVLRELQRCNNHK